MEIAFIGTGTMGHPMAGHLQAAGHKLLLVPRRSAPPSDLVEGGAKICATPAAAATDAAVIITMLPDTPDVEAILFGEDGVAQIAESLSGKTLIDMSSISPLHTKAFARRVAAFGADFLDAPVSGGEIGARDASLTIMVGGDSDAFDRVRPLLETMGRNVTLVGQAGAGQTAKVANQIIVALTIEAVAEALIFAKKAGADPAKVRQALMGGFAASRVLEVHGQRMIEREFDPGARIELHSKDLDLALAGARALKFALPNTASTQQLFNACMARGGGGLDHSALVNALEQLADCSLAPDGG